MIHAPYCINHGSIVYEIMTDIPPTQRCDGRPGGAPPITSAYRASIMSFHHTSQWPSPDRRRWLWRGWRPPHTMPSQGTSTARLPRAVPVRRGVRRLPFRRLDPEAGCFCEPGGQQVACRAAYVLVRKLAPSPGPGFGGRPLAVKGPLPPASGRPRTGSKPRKSQALLSLQPPPRARRRAAGPVLPCGRVGRPCPSCGRDRDPSRSQRVRVAAAPTPAPSCKTRRTDRPP